MRQESAGLQEYVIPADNSVLSQRIKASWDGMSPEEREQRRLINAAGMAPLHEKSTREMRQKQEAVFQSTDPYIVYCQDLNQPGSSQSAVAKKRGVARETLISWVRRWEKERGIVHLKKEKTERREQSKRKHRKTRQKEQQAQPRKTVLFFIPESRIENGYTPAITAREETMQAGVIGETALFTMEEVRDSDPTSDGKQEVEEIKREIAVSVYQERSVEEELKDDPLVCSIGVEIDLQEKPAGPVGIDEIYKKIGGRMNIDKMTFLTLSGLLLHRGIVRQVSTETETHNNNPKNSLKKYSQRFEPASALAFGIILKAAVAYRALTQCSFLDIDWDVIAGKCLENMPADIAATVNPFRVGMKLEMRDDYGITSEILGTEIRGEHVYIITEDKGGVKSYIPASRIGEKYCIVSEEEAESFNRDKLDIGAVRRALAR